MKNNAIWKLKDAETSYELNFLVIYARLSFRSLSLACPRREPKNKKNKTFLLTATAEGDESYEKKREKQYLNSTLLNASENN